jgi:hypothetical protein
MNGWWEAIWREAPFLSALVAVLGIGLVALFWLVETRGPRS